MSRSERLLHLLQVLRRHRRPVSGLALAAETRVSIRTLYRDIASLQAQGAAIDGAPGAGLLPRAFGGHVAIVTYQDAGNVTAPDEANQVMWGQVASANGSRLMAYDGCPEPA